MVLLAHVDGAGTEGGSGSDDRGRAGEYDT
jgi:hypothetical protein